MTHSQLTAAHVHIWMVQSNCLGSACLPPEIYCAVLTSKCCANSLIIWTTPFPTASKSENPPGWLQALSQLQLTMQVTPVHKRANEVTWKLTQHNYELHSFFNMVSLNNFDLVIYLKHTLH